MLNTISDVVESGNCIGCGTCCSQPGESRMIFSENTGLWEVQNSSKNKNHSICPFTNNNPADIDTLGHDALIDAYTDKNADQSDLLGPHFSIAAGYIRDPIVRAESSSGGGVTHLLTLLFENQTIDGVIHLKEDENGLYTYGISTSLTEVCRSKGTKYYPGEISSVLTKLEAGKKYAFIGLPCYVRALRLLQRKNPKYRECIVNVIALVCGHQKSALYLKYIASSSNVEMSNIRSVNFREPIDCKNAHLYRFSMTDKSGRVAKTKPIKQLFAEDWGLGLGMPKACESCDDCSGELSDVTFGDAWIAPYDRDSQGTNIIIFRDKMLQNLFEGSKEFHLDGLTVTDFVNSQAGSFRFRREGVAVRKASESGPTPQTRVGGVLDKNELFEDEIIQRRNIRTKLNRRLEIVMGWKRIPMLAYKAFIVWNFFLVNNYYGKKHGILVAYFPRFLKNYIKKLLRRSVKINRVPYTKNHWLKGEGR